MYTLNTYTYSTGHNSLWSADIKGTYVHPLYKKRTLLNVGLKMGFIYLHGHQEEHLLRATQGGGASSSGSTETP